ncbi:MAG: cytochrome b/b6 domain-containing protein [Candidatus Methanoperedens sp.]|nr:cytochrome b/b6 domain-containing protein [Candidatus Methanoperedens sp.]MCZ7395393.1 cytochrome b/b6 domain-containing protein [Candidatus Methanoperedens sp.]
MPEFEFKRFTLNQRIEHIIFFTTFILLAYTGFPLKFPDEWWSKWMIASVGGFDNRTFIHHSAGLIMIGVSVYHVVYHIILEKLRFDILFNTDDISNFLQQIRYSLRYSDEHPRFGRYTWKQKFEYFGAGFGAVIMGFTGILMWKPFEAMQYFPIGFIQIANLFHTWEAVLASIAIFIGHFYDEHLGKFPNMSWLTGKIPEEELRHEHPLEYEEVMENYVINAPVSKIESTGRYNMSTGFAKLLFTIFFLAISIWMLWISYQVLVEAVKTYIL